MTIADPKPYPAMKDSGVPWLGNVPEHWEMRRGKWLFRKMDRPVQDSDDVVTCFRDGVVTLRKNRRVRGFTESLKEIGYQGICRGDLVIHAMDAFAGAIGVADSDGKGTPVYSVCEPKPTANAHYYAYMLREMSRSQWIQALAKGIRERSTDFRFNGFGSQPVPLPPLPEQVAIVRYLDNMDRRIRKYIRVKQKLIKLLEEQKQAIIHRAVTRGLNPNIRLKPSGVEWFGDVPEPWEVGRLRNIADMRVSNIDKHTKEDEISIRLCNYVDVYKNERITKPVRFMSATATSEEIARFRLELDDVLITKDSESWNDIGVPALVEHSAPDLVCGYHLALLRPFRNLMKGGYLLRAMQSPAVAYQFHIKANGVTRYGLSHTAIKSTWLPVPPLTEQVAIVLFLDEATERIAAVISHAHQEIGLLREYRIRLIADVVTGKLDVREAAAWLPDEPGEPEPIDEPDDLNGVEEDKADDIDEALEEAIT